MCGEFVRKLVYLPELTDANVENGTYDYSITYEYSVNARNLVYFYRIGVYTLANTSYDVPDFTIELNTYIATQNASSIIDLSSGSASGSFTTIQLRSNSSLDRARYGVYLDNLTAGTYKLIIPSGLDLSATVVGTDGSSVDLITSSDMTEGRFSVTDGVEYMLVFHSATGVTSAVNFTVEEAEEIVLSLTQSCEIGTLEGGNPRTNPPTVGGTTTITIGEGVAEGEYKLHIGGSVLIGKNYIFRVVVNGVDEYYTGINLPSQSGGTGASVVIKVKSGDVIEIGNCNSVGIGGTVSLLEV